MMRSRVSGFSDGPWGPDRATEKRAWRHWLDEYETDPGIAVPDDECPYGHRPCPFDTTACCTRGREEHGCWTLGAVREFYRSLGY